MARHCATRSRHLSPSLAQAAVLKLGQIAVTGTTATAVTQETWSNQEADAVAAEQATVRVTYTLRWDAAAGRWLIEEDARRPSPELARRLAEQLAIDPVQRTRFIQVARGERGVSWLPNPEQLHNRAARAGQLPHSLASLVGRDHALNDLRALAVRDGVRLLTMTGPGGTGKTRLALQLAAELAEMIANTHCFRQLETIREYASQLLAASGEQTAIQQRHARFFCALASETATQSKQRSATNWHRLLAADYDNLHAALAWSVASADDPSSALRLATALRWFWLSDHRPLSEGFH